MATRSLTRMFINFRTTYTTDHLDHDFKPRNKKFQEDKVALVSDEDVELGISSDTALSPQWGSTVEEAEYDISKIQTKMKDLSSLHNKHLNRPSMDDSVNEEHVIDISTQEITQLFHQCQRSIQSIQSQARVSTLSQQNVIRNVVSRLATHLQDLSQSFKKGQSNYLKRMKNREEREKEYFDNDFQPTSSFNNEEENFDELYDKGFTTAQLQMLEENNELVREREEEISNIVRSIGDLNTIFKDLAVMIIDQGTILDRIDYNVEQASVTVEQGLQQLVKAESHQKSNRKMICILVLSFILIAMLIGLVITKR